jgi:malate dehydrogenase (oxaloacetate-decarboxylating)(NADP+)
MDSSAIVHGPARVTGAPRLNDALLNKGTAFTDEERERFRLEGLLPTRVESLHEQAARVFENLRAKSTPIERYVYLRCIQDENEALFYRVVREHLEETLPVIYTPTVGEACIEWSRIYQRPRGLYVTAGHRGHIARILGNWPHSEVGIIVVTDGARILGLGDLGANGMGIPIGKLALYTACGGVPPQLCMPVTLDVGTDNEAVKADPFYLGAREPRLTGEPYDALLDEFICATQALFPRAVLQFEDFNNAYAFRLLERYRNRVCCFNDDVQGTGAMGLAGLYSAGRITGRTLAEQRILFVGAGEACLGIGGMVIAAMQREGLTEAQARQACLFVDSKGLVIASRTDLPAYKRPFAQERTPLCDLLAAVEAFKPTALIGACGKPGVFTRDVLQAMARLNERPIVFALSNPTSKSECTAEQAYTWTDGRAIFAGGSPFAPTSIGGRTHLPAQANNAHIFPGLGLGLLASEAARVTDELFLVAAHELAAHVSQAELDEGRVFPTAARMPDVSTSIAVAVAGTAYDRGLARKPRPRDLQQWVMNLRYVPRYA